MFTSANWKNYEEYKKIIKDKDFVDKFTIIGMFYEGLGVLVRKGYLDIESVAFLLCGMTRYFWEKLIPIKDEYRAEAGYSRWFSELSISISSDRYLGAHPELDTRREPEPYTMRTTCPPYLPIIQRLFPVSLI